MVQSWCSHGAVMVQFVDLIGSNVHYSLILSVIFYCRIVSNPTVNFSLKTQANYVHQISIKQKSCVEIIRVNQYLRRCQSV